VGNLEVVPLDIWGRDLSATVTFDRDPFLLDDLHMGPGAVLAPLGDEAFEVQVVVKAVDHLSAAALLRWSGAALEVESESPFATSLQERELAGVACPIHTVFLGLDHHWFSPTAGAPSLNQVEVLIGGETFWEAVADSLEQAQERIHWSTWWWESDFELRRPAGHSIRSKTDRWEETVQGLLEGTPNVTWRVLLNRFWGENSDWTAQLNTDSNLRQAAESSSDSLEVILQANTTDVPVYSAFEGEVAEVDFPSRVLANSRYEDWPIDSRQPISEQLSFDGASWHQKSIVVDNAVAFVSGMNTKGNDWDSTEHAVYDARRMEFDAETWERTDVEDQEAMPDFGPRRDYGVRLEGPAVADVAEMFSMRWEQARGEGDLYAENTTGFSLEEAPAEVPGGVLAQVTATLPAPWNRRDILEAQIKAIGRAESYLFVEDQYFRSPILVQALVRQMRVEPDLVLIVATQPMADTEGGAKFSYLSAATLEALFPGRTLFLQLRAADLILEDGFVWDTVTLVSQDISLHSKLRVLDDRYLSVGSANWNNRGLLFEGELNVEVLDADLVTALRQEIFSQLVGPVWTPWLSDDAWNNLQVLEMAAESNAEILEWWELWDEFLDVEEAQAELDAGWWPSGWVQPLSFSGDYWWDVGPDVF